MHLGTLTAPILVTGASGFLGDLVVTRLLLLGIPVRALLRRPGSFPSRLPGQPLDADLAQPPLFEQVVGDITDPSITRRATEGCAAVIHCAATAGPDIETTRQVNVHGTASVLESAQATGARIFIHISSTAVYARAGLARLDELAPTILQGDAYAVTKAEADRLVLEHAGSGLAVVVLRPANILGLHPSSTWGVRIPLALRFGRFSLHHDGEDTIAFVHANDLVDTILCALARPEAAGQAYNVADFHTTWRAYAEAIRGWFDGMPLRHLSLNQLPEGAYWKGRYETWRVQEALGHRANRTFEEALDELRAFWQGNGRTWLPWGP